LRKRKKKKGAENYKDSVEGSSAGTVVATGFSVMMVGNVVH
jgi:hypothetical protein